MSKYKIMIAETSITDISIENEILSKIDAEIVMTKSTEESGLIECGKDCDGIIVDYTPITKGLIDNLDKCKIIGRMGIGFNNVDVEAASAKKIMVANCPDYCLDEVADHTIALLLSCRRKTPLFNAAIRKGAWSERSFGPMYSLKGQTYALYGFGNIARKVAVRAHAFGFELAAFDPYVPDTVFAEYSVKRIESLEDLASVADIFSIHAPLTKETRGTVNMSIFKRMKPSCTLINTSRGPLIDEGDLVTALEQKLIAAAGLDVFGDEPLPSDSRLFAFENAVLTPHISYYTEESDLELRRKTAEAVASALTDGHPKLTSFINKKDFGY